MSRKTDKILVIDVESACWLGHPPKGMFNEIIEIGIAVMDFKTHEIEEKRSILVKPKYSRISNFCTELTGITEEKLEKHGICFSKACKILEDRYFSKKRIWFSWGNYDKESFIQNCHKKKVEYPFGERHINLRTLYGFTYKIKQDPGVSGALERLGLKFEGKPHAAINDAHNTARIIQRMYEQSTNSIKLV